MVYSSIYSTDNISLTSEPYLKCLQKNEEFSVSQSVECRNFWTCFLNCFSYAVTEEDHLPVCQTVRCSSISTSDDSASANISLFHSNSKNVRWQDLHSSSVNESDEGSDAETVSADSDSGCHKCVPTITFRHSHSTIEVWQSLSRHVILLATVC